MIITKNGQPDFNTSSIPEIKDAYVSVNSGIEIHLICHESTHISIISRLPLWVGDDFEFCSTKGSIALIPVSKPPIN